MARYTTSDLSRKSGDLIAEALRKPVTITQRGKPRLVLLSTEDYRHLMTRADTRDVGTLAALSDRAADFRHAVEGNNGGPRARTSGESVSFEKSGRAQLAKLCRRFHVRRLDVFGSATGPRFDPATSDLDFLVTFAALEPAEYADAFFGLRDALQSFFHRDVDLVTESAFANPYFREQVEAERQTLFLRQ